MSCSLVAAQATFEALDQCAVTVWQFHNIGGGASALLLHHGNSCFGEMAKEIAHYRELVRPKEAAQYWNIKPAPQAQANVVQMSRSEMKEHLRTAPIVKVTP